MFVDDTIACQPPPADADAGRQRQQSLRGYIARRVHANDVDDMMQEVALRLQARRAGALITNERAYLFQIARSVIIDRARRDEHRLRDQHERLTEALHPVEELSPARILEAKQQLAQMLLVIANLPARTRHIFVLHRIERISHAGIAAIVGVSVSSVEKHIMRAAKLLLAERERGCHAAAGGAGPHGRRTAAA